MRAMADKLEGLKSQHLTPGPLKGLLFGSPQRFVWDLKYELRQRSAYLDLVAASKDQLDIAKFRVFLAATETWQGIHGYQTVWRWPGMGEVLRKLKSPVIDRMLVEADYTKTQSMGTGTTPFERHQNFFRQWDNYTPRLIAAMKDALKNVKTT
jgi:hypothetical protein